ncbi:tetrapyrrole methylase, partial [Gaertneriomyces semiglobifer]
PRQHGKLFLVGAGPGAADLLTVRALAALKAADLVVSDRLVSPDVIRLIHTEIIFARKVCGRAREAQDEIYTWTLRALREGKTVVRLKGGDPFVFGRGGEEVIYFSRYGYVPTVIPGISSSISAPLSAGIPITHRGVADQVVIATGRREDGSTPEYPHYSPRRTCVFLMAMGTLRSLTAQLTGKHSFPPNCPCAVVEKATFTEQRVLHGTLETIWQQAEALKITSHATLIVG